MTGRRIFRNELCSEMYNFEACKCYEMNKILLKTPLTYIVLFLILCVFTLLRLDSVSLPYFWDEAWVYGPAVREMAGNGPSILPGAIQEDLSRGHPMLFHFLGGLFLFLFGNTVVNSHVFALLISLCTLFVVFKICQEYLSDLYAALVVISVASFPLFIGQSVLVYPEMMLTLFALLTLYFYLKKKPIYFFISASCLLLTKETGITFLFALAIWNVVKSIFIENKKIFSAAFIKSQLAFVYPLLPLITFFIIQKIKFGYVFFPEHMGMIKTNYDSFEYMIRMLLRELFEYDYKYWLFILFSLVFLLFYRKIKLKQRLLISLLYFCEYKILFGLWPTSPPLAIIVFILFNVLIFSVYLFSVRHNFTAPDELMLVPFLFILVFILFSAINFYTSRYLLICLPFCLLMCFGLFAQLKHSKQIGIGFCVIILCFNFYVLTTTDNNGETTPNYKNVVMAQQEMVDFFESSYSKGDKIYCDFVHSNVLNDTLAGFKKRDILFDSHSDTTRENKYWVTDNFCLQSFYKTVENRKNVKLLREFKHGGIEIRIYTNNY